MDLLVEGVTLVVTVSTIFVWSLAVTNNPLVVIVFLFPAQAQLSSSGRYRCFTWWSSVSHGRMGCESCGECSAFIFCSVISIVM